MSRRICVTERNTPGSIGGGVALPGLGDGKGGGGGRLANVLRGESGGEWSAMLENPRSRAFGLDDVLCGGSAGNLESAAESVAGSRFSTSNDSSSSSGSCSHGP